MSAALEDRRSTGGIIIPQTKAPSTPIPAQTDAERVAELFPEVQAAFEPVGYKLLVQFAKVPEKSKGGILYASQTRDDDQVVVVYARVLKVGPAAFKVRATGDFWPGAPWVNVGDFVRLPRWGGDKFLTRQDKIPLGIVSDEEVIAKVLDLSEVMA